MKRMLGLMLWLLKALVFFTLFAFSLNNMHDSRVHFFFGLWWTAPTVLVVLASFALGLTIGVMGMVPRWWRKRTAHSISGAFAMAAPVAASPPEPLASLQPAAARTQPERPHGA